MIGKGTSISNTRESLEYGWDRDKGAEVVHSHYLAGSNAKEVSQEFKIVQEENLRCKRNTLSFILSPRPEDGRELTKDKLGELTRRFIGEMGLQERQAIGLVHRDKEHVHVHLYVNRISFEGKAYNCGFIGKRSQQMAERVAKQMDLTTVREVQQEKLDRLKGPRSEIQKIHERVMQDERPKTIDGYINAMRENKVDVIPSINKANQLQGFRIHHRGHNFKASEVHGSMSGGKIIGQISLNGAPKKTMAPGKPVHLMGKTVELGANLAVALATSIIKDTIKKAIDTGIEY